MSAQRPDRPIRIASLLSSATEMLYALGAGSQVVAVSHECDFPAEAATKPRVTRTRIAATADSLTIDRQVKALLAAGEPLYELDVQQLASLRPKLIVTQAQCDVCAVRHEDVLQTVGNHPALQVARVVALNPQSLADVLADIARLGEATGRIDEAREYVHQLEHRVARVKARTAGLDRASRPTVGCIEWIEPVMVAGNWMPELIALAGGRQSLTQPGRHSPYANWETFRQFDPDVIVVMPCGFDLNRTLTEAGTLRQMPGWRDLRAVRNHRVYAVDGNAYFNRPGPRLVDSLEILATLLHEPLPADMPEDAWQRGWACLPA